MSLVAKLKLNTEEPLVMLDAPGDAMHIFRDFQIVNKLPSKAAKQVLFFVMDKQSLDATFPVIISKLAENAVFWIVYPKKSSGIRSDLATGMDDTTSWDSIVYNPEYTIVSSASIDDTWSGMRIKKRDPKKVYKRDTPIAERKTEGIDYVKRTVQLPPDALKAMKPFKGLEDFFNTMAFTHKKEYVESIVDAKKPETRQRRIEKMIEMVAVLKTAKENKKK